MLNKANPDFNPKLEESAANPKLIPITDREGISQEFHQAFTQIYKKQDVDDSAEAIQAFLESGGDTKPVEYLRSKALTQDESNKIEGEITMAELEYALFKKMKGSSAPGIDGRDEYFPDNCKLFPDKYDQKRVTLPNWLGKLSKKRKLFPDEYPQIM